MKKKLLFVINQFYKGGAETSLLNLFRFLDTNKYEIDFIIMNQCPVKDAVSLVDSIPSYVNLCDAHKGYEHLSLISRINGRFLYTAEQKCAYYLPALQFVWNKEYDWAFHIGEWWNPSFIAKHVTAIHKAAWIHNDISEAEYFNDCEFFTFFEAFDKFIFVSEASKSSSLGKYPFLADKSICIYNINHVDFIYKKSQDKIENLNIPKNKPIVVTIANIRKQKNHLRQVKVMSELKKRGVDFVWLNFGALTDTSLCNQVLKEVENEGLKENFLLMGPTENPYKYMVLADVVAVLSDYESWSMVITEAKILGTPVISTPTSGACEQIVDDETGILTTFNTIEIADKMQKLLQSQELQTKIKNNLINFDNTTDILKSFDEMVNTKACIEQANYKDILYVIDNINYVGGAHIVTKLQINELIKLGRSITVFSGVLPYPHIRCELPEVKFLCWKDFREDQLFNLKLLPCLLSKKVSKSEKKYKLKLTYQAIVKKNKNVFDQFVLPKISELFSGYDVVCVMSEGSSFKKFVAQCNSKKKVQWIHIDYCDWMNKSEWNKKITKDDASTFSAFDTIVVLSENIKQSFCRQYPHLEKKVVVNANLMPIKEIKQKSMQALVLKGLTRFVTVGRIDYQKAYERLFNVLLNLFDEGYRFVWTIVGSGDDYCYISELFYDSPLKSYVKFVGNQDNPFVFVQDSDVFALLSDFEGLPNTIYEALILGKPVLATNTGGVSYQVMTGKTGWLVENTPEAVQAGIKHVLDNPQEIKLISEKLKNYQYDNTTILERATHILSLQE